MKDTTKNYTETSSQIFFWNSCYSQWFNSRFKDFQGQEFISTEQFMMWHKARLFNDQESQEKIIQSFNPSVTKQLGRAVKGFSDELWDLYKMEVVILGNYYKFSQNSAVLGILLETNKELVEASPEDPVWGIGLHERDPQCLDKSLWKGLNLLGNCIMKSRNIIRYNDHNEVKRLEKYIYNPLYK